MPNASTTAAKSSKAPKSTKTTAKDAKPPVTFEPVTRLAASIARELERLSASPSLTFSDFEGLAHNARTLTRYVNGIRFKLEGAPTATE